MKYFIIITAVLTAVSCANLGLCAQADSASPAAQETTEAVDVGNTVCPVSGDTINPETKATYEYQGKIYNLCGPMCVDEFKNNPDEYVAVIEEEEVVE